MKIYTNIILVWDEDEQMFVEESSDSYEYSGPVTEMKGGGSSTQTVDTDPWSEQQPYLKDLFNQAQTFFKQGAPSSDRSMNALDSYIGQLNSVEQTMTPFLSSAQGANRTLFDGSLMSPSSNPALQEYMDLSNDAISRNYTENVLPQLTSQQAAASGVGGSRQAIIESLSTRNLMDTLQRNSAQLANQGYQSGLDASIKGTALAPQTAQASTMPAELTKQIYAAEDMKETTPYNREAQILSLYKNLIGTGNYGGTQTSVNPYQSGGLSGALGGAAAGAGVASAMPAAYATMNPYIIAGAALLGYMS